MNCLSCKAPIDLGGKHCGACGVAIDADGDGVPDALAKMVEDKARGLLAAERAREAAEVERAATEERAAARKAELERKRQTLVDMKERLEANGRKRRGPWYLDKLVFTVMAVTALLVGAIMFPGCIEPMAERSVVAGPLLCPSVCEGCRGPGRVFTWHESSGSYDGNVSLQLCHNDAVDIDKMSWGDAHRGEDDGDLKKYRLSLWSSVLLDFPLVLFLLFLFVPFFAARFRNKHLDLDRARTDVAVTQLEQELAAASPPMPDAGAYRT